MRAQTKPTKPTKSTKSTATEVRYNHHTLLRYADNRTTVTFWIPLHVVSEQPVFAVQLHDALVRDGYALSRGSLGAEAVYSRRGSGGASWREVMRAFAERTGCRIYDEGDWDE